MKIRTAILSEIENLARQQGKPLPESLSDDLILQNAAFDSLCWAIIVARLEEEFGVDPFEASEKVYFPVTLGEFIVLYEKAVG